MDNNQIKWPLIPELSIYQTLPKKHTHTSKEIYKIILFYWFGSLTSGSQSVSATPRLNTEEPQAITRDYKNSSILMPHNFHTFKTTRLKQKLK